MFVHECICFVLSLIELSGLDIEAEHCVAERVEGSVYLTPLSENTSINNDTITCRTKLTHGTMYL